MKPVVGHWSLHQVPRSPGDQPRTEGGLFAVAAVSVANPVLTLPLGAFAVASLGAVIIASIEETSDAEKTAWKAESATGQPSLV